MAKPFRELRAQLSPAAQAAAEQHAQALLAAMPDPVCELCGDPTPTRLVRADPAGRWDTLCPACWLLNTAGEESAQAPPVWEDGLWQTIHRRAREIWEAARQSGHPVLTMAEIAAFAAEMAGISPPLDGLSCAERSSLADTFACAPLPPWRATGDADALRDVPAAQPSVTPEEYTAWRHAATRLYGTHCVCAVCRGEATHG